MWTILKEFDVNSFPVEVLARGRRDRVHPILHFSIVLIKTADFVLSLPSYIQQRSQPLEPPSKKGENGL